MSKINIETQELQAEYESQQNKLLWKYFEEELKEDYFFTDEEKQEMEKLNQQMEEEYNNKICEKCKKKNIDCECLCEDCNQSRCICLPF